MLDHLERKEAMEEKMVNTMQMVRSTELICQILDFVFSPLDALVSFDGRNVSINLLSKYIYTDTVHIDFKYIR